MPHLMRNIKNLFKGPKSNEIMPCVGTVIDSKISQITNKVYTSPLKFKVPYITGRLICMTDRQSLIISYRHLFGKNIRITSICPLEDFKSGKTIQHNPEADVILSWNNFLRANIEMKNIKREDISSAIPLQLSLLSPFDPYDICFCINPAQISSSSNLKHTIDYSHYEEVRKKLSFLANSNIFPCSIVSGPIIWEFFLHKVIKISEFEDSAYFLYIHFTAKHLQLGILGPDQDIAPKILKYNNTESADAEVLYNTMLTYLAGFQNRFKDNNISRIFIIDQNDKSRQFLDHFKSSLPAPVDIIDPEQTCHHITGIDIVNNTGVKLPLIAYPYLCLDIPNSAIIEPSKSLKIPFQNKYLKSHSIYSGILLIIAMILTFTLLLAKLDRSERYLKEVQAETTQLKPAYQNLSMIEDKLDKSLYGGSSNETSLSLLFRLTFIKPQGLQFSSINYLRDSRISLRGYANNQGMPVQYVKDLQQDTSFSDVSLKYVSQKGNTDRPLIEFQIEIELRHEEY
jgi:Fimbrial assembly protein (PilN)